MARVLTYLAAVALLSWPALLNGYPLVFADTGTYLSQAVHHYLGWDRPIFYSVFLLPLHLTLTTWPVIVVQALLTLHMLTLAQRALSPFAASRSCAVLPITAFASIATALPWFTSELMPDIFTPLLVLALAVLILAPERLSRAEHVWLTLFAAFMIAAQQSSVPLALGLLLILLPLRRVLGASAMLSRRGLLHAVAPVLLALVALIATNIAAFRRVSPSPYGNMFVLARIIYDGPGMHVLLRDCPRIGWRLCTDLEDFPTSSDAFLWSPQSPVLHVGGHKAVSAEADSIILAALRAEPRAELLAWLSNGLTQLAMFRTGDGLLPCPVTVAPWIARDFPRVEHATYAASLQSRGLLHPPSWMPVLHSAVAVAGAAGSVILLMLGIRRRHLAGGFAAAVLLGVLGNAFIAGGLSTPHDRYGSRVMLLPPIVTILGGAAMLGERRPLA